MRKTGRPSGYIPSTILTSYNSNGTDPLPEALPGDAAGRQLAAVLSEDLMSPEAILVTFNSVAENDSVLMGRVLQAAVAALANVQSAEAVEAEMKRRAVKGN